MTTMLYHGNGAWTPSPALATTPSNYKRVTGCGCTYVNDLVPDEEIHCNGFQIIFDGKQYPPPDYVEVSKINTDLGPVEIWTSIAQRKDYQDTTAWNVCKDLPLNIKQDSHAPEKAFYFYYAQQYLDQYSGEFRYNLLKPGSIYFVNPARYYADIWDKRFCKDKKLKLLWQSNLAINTHGMHRGETIPCLKLYMFTLNAE